jgi:toxin CcdB
MARFDVFAMRDAGTLVVDCQADLLADLKTRVVVPLIREEAAPKPARRLNPVFLFAGERFVLMTQFLAAVEVRELVDKVGSLESEGETVLGALDFLLTGV